MCQQQLDMASHMQELYLQGMPRKIGKSVEMKLKRKQNLCTDKNCQNNQSCQIEAISEKSAETTTTMVATAASGSGHPSHIDRSALMGGGGGHPSHIDRSSALMKVMPSDDVLAVFTKLTRIVFHEVHAVARGVQTSNAYKVLSKSTQPAHVIAVGILSFVLLAVWPNILDEEATMRTKERKSGVALVVYLAAFATHFGAQIWMTFVSGLALYFSLPRHTFGLCQQILFPKYFALNSILSICTLIMYVKVMGGRWEFSSYVQVIALTICAVIEVTVRLYLAPPLLRLMREKHKFEMSVGSGQEVGHLEQRDLVKCPHYQKIHKSFRRIHMTVAMGNLTVLVCTCLHLHYLALRISVS